MNFICFFTVTEEQISTCGNRNTWEVSILDMQSLTTTYSRSEITFWTNVVTKQKVNEEQSLFWQCRQNEFCFILFADLSSSGHNRHHLSGAIKKRHSLWKSLAPGNILAMLFHSWSENCGLCSVEMAAINMQDPINSMRDCSRKLSESYDEVSFVQSTVLFLWDH